MNTFWNFATPLLGLGAEPRDLTVTQIAVRGVIVFIVTLIMVRLGHKRSLSRKTAFDAVLLVILASVLSRAINGSAAFFATLGGGFVLVLFVVIGALISLGVWIPNYPSIAKYPRSRSGRVASSRHDRVERSEGSRDYLRLHQSNRGYPVSRSSVCWTNSA